MSDARSLTALSETDYEAIAGAVMETARGRWFMSEFAKRNRQADTQQLLSAIGRIERVVGTAAPAPTSEANLREAAALIVDLRADLERIGGRSDIASSDIAPSGLASRIESAAGAILSATEKIQDAAWNLRESGADDALCDLLDRHATDIYAASAIVEGTGHRIGKIADTIAMLDSSLRAFGEGAHVAAPLDIGDAATAQPAVPGLRDAFPLGSYDDIEIIEIDDSPRSALHDPAPVPAKPVMQRRRGAIEAVEEDVEFAEIGEYRPASHPALPAAGASETALRNLDAMPAAEKLAYFA